MKIDFEKIKRELSIERVLIEYGLMQNLKQNGSRLYGKCPIHNGDNPRAFNVSLDKNLWNCFTNCGGGTVIDLLMAIENVNSYEAGKLGYEMLGINKSENLKRNKKSLELNLILEDNHQYLKTRNIDPKTAKHFGIGYCKKGLMAGKIAIPIHDVDGNLMAYCGRAVDNAQPKYFFPRGFQKNRIVYNLNRIGKNSNEEVVVVEGFFDVFALYKAGIDSVAIMGCSLSYHQKKQLISLDKKLTIMFDGDKSGINGMIKAINVLYEKKPLKAIYLPENTQPEHFKEDKLIEIIH
jgi:DNA primase